MISHPTEPRHFKSIAIWISALMPISGATVPISGATYGQITQIIDSVGVAGTVDTLAGADGIATDGSGNVFVADRITANVFKITPGGAITQIIGPAGDGTGNTLAEPILVATDGSGNVFVAGRISSNAFKITPQVR